MKAYKGFNKDMTCRGFQYEEGKTYEMDFAMLCHHGFHACEHPLDCFGYYPPANSVYREVELDGVTDEEGDDTKCVGTKITVKGALNIMGLINATFEYVKSQCTNSKSGGNYSALTGGYRSALTGGDRSALTGGDMSALMGGNYSALSGGDMSALTGGYMSALMGGDMSALTGGNRSALTGGYMSALMGGDMSALTGGNRSALTGGDMSALTGGNRSVVYGGIGSKVRGGLHSVLAIAYRDEHQKMRIAFAEVDGEKIKADTWYRLDDNHEFVEVE